MKYITLPTSKKGKYYVRYTKNESDKLFSNGTIVATFKEAKQLHKAYLKKAFKAYLRMKFTKPDISWTYTEAVIDDYNPRYGNDCRTKMKNYNICFNYKNRNATIKSKTTLTSLEINSMELLNLRNDYPMDMSQVVYTKHIARILADVKGIDKTNLRPKRK